MAMIPRSMDAVFMIFTFFNVKLI